MVSINAQGVSVRFAFALLLVFASYNPTGYSYYHWMVQTLPSFTPQLALSGIALLIAWAIYLRATFRSLGLVGLALSSALFACVVWLFIDIGWLSVDNVSAMSWVILSILSAVLAIGMSWSLIRRRMTGQVDTDDVDE